MTSRFFLVLAGFVTVFLAGCGSGSSSPPVPKSKIDWPRPTNPMQLTRKAGLVPEDYEHLEYHVHAHLDVFVNRKRVTVPAGIGIDITNPHVQSARTKQGMEYGGITNCYRPCISPLHTHDTTGILHTETSTPHPNTLGQFFTEWNRRLTPTCVASYCEPHSKVAFYVNGKRFHGDPRTILLSNHREIAVVIGKPPRYIPVAYNWG